jgi:hypothetical protein
MHTSFRERTHACPSTCGSARRSSSTVGRGRSESEANYDGVRADDVFAQLDFGRLIATDSAVTTAEEHVFLVSALGLCHLCFGFALLVRSALGSD